jgi:DNA adenine methylase
MKYLGGKQRLGKHLSPVLHDLFQKYNSEHEVQLDNYLEPFCGSLGVLKHLTDLGVPIQASDYHPDLICMWKGVQDGSLVFPESVSEEEFLQVKQLESPNALKAFVGFGMSFGGRFFGAYSQKYLGDKKEDFCKEMRNSLNRTRPMIVNVDFTCQDYRVCKPVNAFVYCDPPYRFNKYPVKYRTGTKGYDVFDNDEFWEVMREWSKTNFVVISEVTAPEDFVEIWSSVCVRSAAQSAKTRNNAKSEVVSETHCREKLFTRGAKPPFDPPVKG